MLTNIFQEQFAKQSKEGLYQNKVTLTLASIHDCKMAYWRKKNHTYRNWRSVSCR